jgi:arylsulfatase A-like enzyme
MRILYIDIDTLRPDHLGCYGYHRSTSPHIDALAQRGVRFDNCYNSDAPCLPSRTAMWSGRCGYHTGVVDHGGTAAEPFVEGPERGFRDLFDTTCWMRALRREGIHTATVSPFGERHGAWHWYAAFNEIHNPGKGGMEIADDVIPTAIDWIDRNGRSDDWFLHVNLWDPHTPYRTPEWFGNPFAGQPLPAWLTEEVRRRGWDGYGPHSPQEVHGWGDEAFARWFPRVPPQLDSMEAVRQWIDGYDTGILYADEGVGRLVASLGKLGVLDEVAIIVGSDHGESQGELNVWGDHQTADAITGRVPLIVCWPGIAEAPRVDSSLLYQYDWAATAIELVGGDVPENWDGRSFAPAFRQGSSVDCRDYLVVSQNAWSCQRSVRFDEYICLRTYHDGYKMLEPVMLFDLERDPHEQHDLAPVRPGVVDAAMRLLENWHLEMASTSRCGIDPLLTVMHEGGAFHTRGKLRAYVDRLRSTGRSHHADHLLAVHPGEA